MSRLQTLSNLFHVVTDSSDPDPAFDALSPVIPALDVAADALPTIPPPPPNFIWNDALSGNYVGTGWLNNGATGVPGAEDVADMSVTGAAYTVLCDNVTITSDGGTWTFTDYVLGSLILGVDTTLEINANSFDLQYGGTSNGTILIDSILTVGNSGSNVVNLSGNTSLGFGHINLNDSYPNATLTGYGTGAVLNLHYEQITGAGTITNLTLSLDKYSSIIATGTHNTFVLDPGNTIYSEGGIFATAGATLKIENVTIDESPFVKGDSAGVIQAVDPTATILLYSVHIEGGEIWGGGVFQFTDAGSVIDGSTSAGAVTVDRNVLATGGDTLTLKGLILNHGNIEIQGGTQLTIDATSGATLSSGGVGLKGALTFDDNASNSINTNNSHSTLTNVDSTISGAVSFYNMTIVNEAGGTIDATGTNNQIFIIGDDTLENYGTLEATGAAGLYLGGQVIDAALGGKILVGAGSVIHLASDTFKGGLISSLGTGTGAGKWVLLDGGTVLDGSTTSGAVTLTTTLAATNGDGLTLKGTIHNDGLLAVQGGTQLTIDSAGVTLDGGGLVTFDDNASNSVNTNNTKSTLTNVNNLLSGSFSFYNTTIVNEKGGTIKATGANNQIFIVGDDTLENYGTLEANGAAGLYIGGQVIDAALGGKIVVDAGSVIHLASDTFKGGLISSLGTGPGAGKWVLLDGGTVLDGSTTSGAVTLTTTLAATNGDGLTLKGTIHNEGLLAVQGGTQLTIDSAGVTLDGGGLVTFDDNASNSINTNNTKSTLTNVDNMISGSFSFYNTTIVNEKGGTIKATGANNQIFIVGDDTLENHGTLEANGAAGLYIGGQVIDAALGGKIVVDAGSVIDLASDTFKGGLISSLGTGTGAGKWVLLDGGTVLDGSTTSGAVTLTTTLAANGNGLTLKGTIHDAGALAMQGGATLTIDSAGVTLDGGGKVTFDDNASNSINTNNTKSTLTNVNDTISGSVRFYNTAIVNETGGTINATGQTNQIAIVGDDTLENGGLLEATGAAGLYISGVTVKNVGGTIYAAGGSKVELLSDAITLGTLQTSGTGIIEIADSGTVLSASNVANGLTLAATIQIDDGQMLAIAGSVINSGKIEVGVTGAATLELGATLSGGGSIVLFDSASSQITVGFNNVNNTISGAGTISATIQQQAGGVIEATHLDNALILATGVAIANGGVLEANGGTLIVDDAVTGAGNVVITNRGSASFAAAFNENVNFLGANAGALDLTDAYSGTIAGFGVGDSIELLGLSADNVYLNAADQLVVNSGTTNVAKLQLSGNYGSAQFTVVKNASGVEILEILAPTVAQYLANKTYYDGLAGGFAITDSAATIQTNLTALAADAHIVKILSNSGVVTVAVATFKSAKSALDKVTGGFAIADTASNIVAALSALVADAANIRSISLTGGTLAVSTSQFDTYKALLNTIPGGFTVADTATHVQSDLAALQADVANISAITLISGSVAVSATTFLANKAALDKIVGGFILSDTAGSVIANIAAIAADAARIQAVQIGGAKITVSASQATTYRVLLDKVAGGFAISDTAASIQANLTALLADAANIVSIVSTTGDVTVSDAVFKADRTLLDKVTPGITVSDTATNIVADLGGLGADAHIDKIISNSGAVTVSVATFTGFRTGLDKVAGGFVISDTATSIVAALGALLADAPHIHSITLTSGTVTVSTTQFVTYRALLDTFAAGFAVADTAAAIFSNLSALQADAANISAITLTGGSLVVTAALFVANQTALDKVVGGFTITDTAQQIVANLDKIAADATHIVAVNVTGAVVVSALQAVNDRTTLDKIAGGFAVSDTAASIQANLAPLFADANHIVAISSTSGDVTVSDSIFNADRVLLDKVTTGFVVNDTAVNILADLANLGADTHISKIISSSGAVKVSVATFNTSARNALDKISGGFVISDTSASILAALATLKADLPHIQSIALTSGTLTISTAQFGANQAVFDKIAGGFAISDTAANVQSHLAALQADAANISAITLTSGSLAVTVAIFLANQAALDKITGGFTIADTAANVMANIDKIGADATHVKALNVTGVVTVSAAQAVKDRTALDKISAGFKISDTAANIQAVLASLVADNAKIVSITSTSGHVTVSDAIFEADRALLDKVTPGIVISDLGAHIVADLAHLLADNSHIASLVATDSAPSVAFATFTTYASLLNKVVGGFAIRDLAATIKANFAAIVADTAHISSITSTDKALKFGAAGFVANETTLNKVTGGVAISDTKANIIASALSLLGDIAHIQSVYFTDVGTPTLKLTALQVAEVQPILSKIANNYILDDLTAPGVTITTGHGNFLTINDVPTNDTITGGGTNETFVFGAGLGHAELVDFYKYATGTTHDTIQLSATDFGGFHQLTTLEASQHQGNVWLQSKSSGDLIVIDNMTTQTLGTLSADFKFV